jgi:hypothetical protein
MGTSPVSKSRLGPRPSLASPEPPLPADTGLVAAWTRFWFAPTDPVGLHIVRLVAGLVFLAWLLPLAGNIDAFFGLGGYFDRKAFVEAAALPGGPPAPFTWSLLYLCGSNAALVTTVYWAAIAVLVLFTLGVWTPLTATLTWLVVGSFSASPALGADADSLLLILALYLMIGYVLRGLSLDKLGLGYVLLRWGDRSTLLLGGRTCVEPQLSSRAANFALRLLQVHLAILVLVSGLHKLQFGDWWAGSSLWYPLHPLMELTRTSAGTPEQVSTSLWFLGLAGYGVLAWQIGFPFFAWRQRWRIVLLGGAVLGWLGCALIYREPVFGPALLVSSLSYVAAPEWQRLLGRLTLVPGLRRLTPQLAAAPEPLVTQGTR